jgi:hypothetical protein
MVLSLKSRLIVYIFVKELNKRNWCLFEHQAIPGGTELFSRKKRKEQTKKACLTLMAILESSRSLGALVSRWCHHAVL